MLEPSDLFTDFPEVRLGMSFPGAKKALEKSGAHPVAFRNVETELAWEGTFDDMNGRGTILFKADTEAYELGVVVYAMDKRGEVFEQWLKTISERHGAPTGEEDNSPASSKLWKLKNRVAIELRLLKDEDSPVVDIHWAKNSPGKSLSMKL